MCPTSTVRHTHFRWDPPRLAEESKPSPAQKVKKESSGESLGESPGVLADPPKRVKNESLGDSGDSFFDSLGGGRPGPSETPLETLPETLF